MKNAQVEKKVVGLCMNLHSLHTEGTAPKIAAGRRGLLDGTSDKIQSYNFADGSIPELWTNERGLDLLEVIRHDAGIFFDLRTDTLVYPEDHGSGYGSIAIH